MAQMPDHFENVDAIVWFSLVTEFHKFNESKFDETVPSVGRVNVRQLPCYRQSLQFVSSFVRDIIIRPESGEEDKNHISDRPDVRLLVLYRIEHNWGIRLTRYKMDTRRIRRRTIQRIKHLQHSHPRILRARGNHHQICDSTCSILA